MGSKRQEYVEGNNLWEAFPIHADPIWDADNRGQETSPTTETSHTARKRRLLPQR
jgi:hypothetical protein